MSRHLTSVDRDANVAASTTHAAPTVRRSATSALYSACRCRHYEDVRFTLYIEMLIRQFASSTEHTMLLLTAGDELRRARSCR